MVEGVSVITDTPLLFVVDVFAVSSDVPTVTFAFASVGLVIVGSDEVLVSALVDVVMEGVLMVGRLEALLLFRTLLPMRAQ